MEISDEELRRLDVRGNPEGRKLIRTTYEIITEESAAEGDVEEAGWEDEEGVEVEPDEYDLEEGKTVVDLAVDHILSEGHVELPLKDSQGPVRPELALSLPLACQKTCYFWTQLLGLRYSLQPGCWQLYRCGLPPIGTLRKFPILPEVK